MAGIGAEIFNTEVVDKAVDKAVDKVVEQAEMTGMVDKAPTELVDKIPRDMVDNDSS